MQVFIENEHYSRFGGTQCLVDVVCVPIECHTRHLRGDAILEALNKVNVALWVWW